jgi:glycosyltransferase involved in cell wall biosynthesis
MLFPKLNLPRLLRLPLFELRSLLHVLGRARSPGLIVYTRCHLFAWLATTFGIPAVLELHVGFALTHPLRQRALVAASRNSALKRIVVISDGVRDDVVGNLRQRGLVRLPDILVAQNGAPTPKAPSEAFAWRGRKDALQVGYVGHLYPGRGIETILGLGAEFPDVDFHIVGGRPEDVEHWKSTHPTANVIFHGHVPHAQVCEFLNRFDVALAPYARQIFCEGGKSDTSQWFSPLKLFDYMSYGLAIVVSDLPRIREVFAGKEAALLCDPEDREAWRLAVQRLRDDPALRAQLGTDARQLQAERFDAKARAATVLDKIEV